MELGLGRGQLGQPYFQLGLVIAVIGPEERGTGFDLLPLLDEDLDNRPGIFTPIGMFSRRASTSPDPATIVTRSGRVGGSTIGRAGGGTCWAWITE